MGGCSKGISRKLFLVYVCSDLKSGVSSVEINYEHIRHAGPPLWKFLCLLVPKFPRKIS